MWLNENTTKHIYSLSPSVITYIYSKYNTTNSTDSCDTSSALTIQSLELLSLCFVRAISWGYANEPTDNSPLQWNLLLRPHLSGGMTASDWLNCPENKGIHLENDMPLGGKRLKNLSAFHTVKKRGALRCDCLQTSINKQSLVTHTHDIVCLWLHIRHGVCVCVCTSAGCKQSEEHKLTYISFNDSHFHEDNSYRMGVLGKYSRLLYISVSVSKLIVCKPKLQHETLTTEAWIGERGVTFLRRRASHRQTKDSRAWGLRDLMSVFTAHLSFLTHLGNGPENNDYHLILLWNWHESDEDIRKEWRRSQKHYFIWLTFSPRNVWTE